MQFSNVQMTSVADLLIMLAAHKYLVFARHTVASVLRRLDTLKNGTHDTGNEDSSGIAPAVAESKWSELQEETTLVFTLARYCCTDDHKRTNRHFLHPNNNLLTQVCHRNVTSYEM